MEKRPAGWGYKEERVARVRHNRGFMRIEQVFRQKKTVNLPRFWAFVLIGIATVVALRGLAPVTRRTEAQTERPAAVGKGTAAMETTHAHTNRLIHETSPYLLQHAHNPVDWYS